MKETCQKLMCKIKKGWTWMFFLVREDLSLISIQESSSVSGI